MPSWRKYHLRRVTTLYSAQIFHLEVAYLYSHGSLLISLFFFFFCRCQSNIRRTQITVSFQFNFCFVALIASSFRTEPIIFLNYLKQKKKRKLLYLVLLKKYIVSWWVNYERIQIIENHIELLLLILPLSFILQFLKVKKALIKGTIRNMSKVDSLAVDFICVHNSDR